jgi:carbamoyltransferase
VNILGISAWYHDAAACLVRDGEIVAAAQEERFTRKKHDPEFPHHAIRSCLEIGGIRAEELDAVGFYDKPFLKFERLLETYLACAPKGLSSFHAAMPVWLRRSLPPGSHQKSSASGAGYWRSTTPRMRRQCSIRRRSRKPRS